MPSIHGGFFLEGEEACTRRGLPPSLAQFDNPWPSTRFEPNYIHWPSIAIGFLGNTRILETVLQSTTQLAGDFGHGAYGLLISAHGAEKRNPYFRYASSA